MAQYNFDANKLAELIIFFAHESNDDRFFGSTKLNKLLLLSDFKAFGYLGEPVTGADYVHQKFGPTPAPRQLLPILEHLVNNDRLRIDEAQTYKGLRRRPVALSEPDLSVFSEAELQICQDTLNALRHMSNEECSEWSHDFLGWLSTKEGEIIPYETAFIWEKRSVTKDTMDWAIRKAINLDLQPY